MKALVTGGGGFLGQYVVEQLAARGDRVRALCRGDCPQLGALGVETVRADLRDRAAVVEACRGVDAVFHVAGVEGITGAWKRYFENNTLGTRHVVEGCLAHGVGRLVYTSSPSVVFDGRSQEGVDETVPYPKRWMCHYARSKALAEQEVLAANGKGGLLCCALRPHLIFGPRDRRLIPKVVDLAARPASPRRRRPKPDRHGVRRERRGGPSASGRRPDARLARGRPDLFHQPRRAGELLGVDRRDSRLGGAAAGAEVALVAGGVGAGRGLRDSLVIVAAWEPTADEPLSGSADGRVTLLRYYSSAAGFWLSAEDFHGRGDASAGGRISIAAWRTKQRLAKLAKLFRLSPHRFRYSPCGVRLPVLPLMPAVSDILSMRAVSRADCHSSRPRFPAPI